MLEIVEPSSINRFGLPTGHVPPSDQLITLTYGQLQDLIQEIIEQATIPLIGRLENLEREVRGRGVEGGAEPTPLLEAHTGQNLVLQIVQDLRAENVALKGELEDLQEITARERAADRRRIAALERPAPMTSPAGTKTAERVAKIRAILKSGARTFGELERLLKISPREMLRITKRLDMRQYEITRRPGDARQKVLRLRSQLGGGS